MKYFLYILIGLGLLVSGFVIGAISGYANGTSVSMVTARSVMAADSARTLALSLNVHEEGHDDAVEFLLSTYEESLISNLEDYYQFQDVELFLNNPLKRFSYFELLYSSNLDIVKNYIKANKTETEIRNTPVYLRLLNEEEN